MARLPGRWDAARRGHHERGHDEGTFVSTKEGSITGRGQKHGQVAQELE